MQAEPICGGRFGHLGPGNRYGELALTNRESGLYGTIGWR